MKRLIALLFIFILCASSTAGAQSLVLRRPIVAGGGGGTPTYFASASNPSDPGEQSVSPTAVTPPANTVSGDLVVLVGHYRGASSLAMSQVGGQSWSAAGSGGSASHTIAAFYCTFNGTWSANPSMTSTATTNGFTVMMHVFRPGSTPHSWSIDVAATTGALSTPGGPPYDVTITGVTTGADNAVVLFTWLSTDDNSWQVQTSGWAAAGSAQYRNIYGADGAASSAYLIKVTQGATGDAVNRQTALGPDSGFYHKVSFK